MALRNTEHQWGSISKWLHWVIAVLMLAAITCAVWADQLDPDVPGDPELWRFLIMKLHKPLGFTAMILIIVRVAWMLTNVRPALPESMTEREVQASRIAHALLYAGMLIVPVTGWFMSQYADSSVDYFGLFEINNIVAADKEKVAALHTVHVTIGLTLLGLVVLHIAAALFHAIVRKDGVLSAMLPERRSGDR